MNNFFFLKSHMQFLVIYTDYITLFFYLPSLLNTFKAADIVSEPHGSLLGSKGFEARLVCKELVRLK